ncbi:MAG: F-box protein [Kistimonas sp.]|nr:F-box protein [Kistimonas sp.]
MRKRLSGSEPGHRPLPAPQTATAQLSEKDQPTALSGRSVAAACLPDRPTPLTRTGIALSESPNAMHTPSLAQNLPDLVLRKIFSYLPPVAQCRCARVCRHWESCLPSLRERLALWLQQEQPVSNQAAPGWGQAFSSRTRPFLQASNSPLLPTLMQLLPEPQQHRHATAGQDTEHQNPDLAVSDLFSCLVHYSLHHQLIQARRLRLRPAAITGPDKARAQTFLFSSCSRWLATECQFQVSAPTFLRLYGWDGNHWQTCPLTPEPTEPVATYCFPLMPTDRLLSAHGQQVLSWDREPDANMWHGTLVHLVSPSHEVLSLCPMANGDTAILTTCEQDNRELPGRLSFHRCSDGTWQEVAAYRLDFVCRAHQPQSSQLALTRTWWNQGPGYYTNEVLVWHLELNTHSRRQWNYQLSVLAWHCAPIDNLVYSPGGKYLLGILLSGRACLWALDAQYRLQEKLTLADCLRPPEGTYKYPASFSADEKWLALPLDARQIQLCLRDDNDNWLRGQVLQAPFVPAARPAMVPHTIRLSANGRIMVRATPDQLDIWYRPPAGHWQHSLQRQNKTNARFPPCAALVNAGELVCTTAEDPTLSLWIHGPDSQGRFVRKACRAVNIALSFSGAASPDGLSLIVSSTTDPLFLLQVVPPEDSQARLSADRQDDQTRARHGDNCLLL